MQTLWLDDFLLDESNSLPAEELVLHHRDSWVDLLALADRDARHLTGFDFVRLPRPS